MRAFNSLFILTHYISLGLFREVGGYLGSFLLGICYTLLGDPYVRLGHAHATNSPCRLCARALFIHLIDACI